MKVESEHLSKLAESKEELISKVSMLKKDLLEWRTKLDGQVKTFRGVRCSDAMSRSHVDPRSLSMQQEITDLRRTLTSEIDLLRGDFIELKQALKNQLEVTAGFTTGSSH